MLAPAYSIQQAAYPTPNVHYITQSPPSAIIAQQPIVSSIPAPSTHGIAEFSQLIADTKIGIAKIDLKLDEINKNVEFIKENNIPRKDDKSLISYKNKQPDDGTGHALADPITLLKSISRVVEENTNLKREVSERSTRIEALNNKIRNVLESNQKYVEQSHQMMEQKSDSLHSASSLQQSQILR